MKRLNIVIIIASLLSACATLTRRPIDCSMVQPNAYGYCMAQNQEIGREIEAINRENERMAVMVGLPLLVLGAIAIAGSGDHDHGHHDYRREDYDHRGYRQYDHHRYGNHDHHGYGYRHGY